MPTDQRASAPVRDRLFVLFQHVLPHHAVSRVVHWATRIRLPAFKNALIRWFVKQFNVDLSEAQHTSPSDYPDFNAFFTRALKPDARPIDDHHQAIVSPVDGTVSQLGAILEDRLYQAKSHTFDLRQLLGGEVGLAERFHNGCFLTIYLAPHNYHRIHMPADGQLEQMRYNPGRLFSVNAASVERIPGLFCANERVVCVFDTENGPMACILVGALNVGSIETVWAGEVTPGRSREARSWTYTGTNAVQLKKGEEMGRFNMGSTVIVLFAERRVALQEDLGQGSKVKMGQAIAKFTTGDTGNTGKNT